MLPPLSARRQMTFKVSTRIEGSSCLMAIDRVREGVILVRIDGHDVGEFGDAPIRCVEALMSQEGDARLFIDARHARGVSMEASEVWARWFAGGMHGLRELHMLTSAKQVEVSAAFVRRFAGLQDRMHLYSDSSAFERSLVHASA